MRTARLLAVLPLILAAACQPDAEPVPEETQQPIELDADAELPTIAETTELAWSTATIAGIALAAHDLVVSYSWGEGDEVVLTGAAVDTGEVEWRLAPESDGVEGTELRRWLVPRPETVTFVDVDGEPAILARALDGDLSDASPECDTATAQHAVVAIAVDTGDLLWTAHPAPPQPETDCQSIFEFDLVTTEDIAVVNGSGDGGRGLRGVALDLDTGTVLWHHDGVELTRSTMNAVIGVQSLADTGEARCGLDHEYLFTGHDIETGEPRWELDPCEDPEPLGTLAYQALFAFGDGASAEIRALDALTGETVASWTGAILPKPCPTDGDRYLVCPIEVDGDEALLRYDAETTAFEVLDFTLDADAGLPYTIRLGQLACYSDEADTTRLYDLATGERTAEFPGWWSDETGEYRLSTAPPYLAEAESPVDIYTVPA